MLKIKLLDLVKNLFELDPRIKQIKFKQIYKIKIFKEQNLDNPTLNLTRLVDMSVLFKFYNPG